MTKTHWQRTDVTEHYLQEVRGGIPFGAEQVKIMLQVIGHFSPGPKKIIDLGCGNGFLAKVLLETYPEATAILIDHSEPMVANAQIYMKDYHDRCQIVHGDFSHALCRLAEFESIDCIVSGFAIHHLTHEQKRQVYEEIYQLLTPGGIFLNIEHTASATPELEHLYDELFIDHLAAHNQRTREPVAAEYYARPDKEDNILERADIQVQWLREIGFNQADCYFKWLELAVFGGVK